LDPEVPLVPEVPLDPALPVDPLKIACRSLKGA
jgi:hypothetical protein